LLTSFLKKMKENPHKSINVKSVINIIMTSKIENFSQT